MIPVENHPNLMKTETGLVVNVDASGYNRYMNQKNVSVKMVAIESEINTIKQDMWEIKTLLQTLINDIK